MGVEGGHEVWLGGDAGEGGLVADGGFFPEVEVTDVGFAVAAEGGGLDAVGVAGFPLGIDEVVVTGPCGIGLGGGEGAEEDGCALALGKGAEDGVGIGGEEEIGEEDAEGVGAEGEAVDFRRGGGIAGGEGFDIRLPAVRAEGEGIDGKVLVSGDGVDADAGTGGEGGIREEGEEFGGAFFLFRREKHGGGGIEDEIDDGADFLAEELHGILAGACEGLPVDVAGIIAGGVGAVILEVHGGTGAGAGEFTGRATPDTGAEGEP